MDQQLPEVFRFLVSVARSDAGSRFVDSAANWISSRYGVGIREAQAFITELENQGYGTLDDSGARFSLTPDAKLVANKVTAYLASRKRPEGASSGAPASASVRPSNGPRSLEDFLEATASYYRVDPLAFLVLSRKRPLARRRQVLMYLMKTDGGFSLPVIGHFMQRDHTTVLHACRLIEKLRTSDPIVDVELTAIRGLVART